MRVAALALSVLVCAVLSGLVALFVWGQTLSPSKGVLDSLAEPWLRDIWLGLTLGSALFGVAASLLMLWDVNLVKAVPFVLFITVAVAAGTAATPFVMFSPLAALGAGLVTMQWCYSRTVKPLNTAKPTSVFRAGLRELKSGNASGRGNPK